MDASATALQLCMACFNNGSTICQWCRSLSSQQNPKPWFLVEEKDEMV